MKEGKKMLEKEFEKYKISINNEVVLTKNPKSVEPSDLRRIQVFPPIYTVLVEEHDIGIKLFKGVILTEEITLGWLDETTPVLDLKEYGISLVTLPLWVFFPENFLYLYSEKIDKINSDLNKFLDYAKKKKTPENIQGEYIRLIMRRMVKILKWAFALVVLEKESNNIIQ